MKKTTPAEMVEIVAKVDEYRAKIAADPTLRRYYGGLLKSFEDKLAQAGLDRAPDGEEWMPTEYARDGKTIAEDYAESVMLFLKNPERLARWCPKRYAFIRDNVFDGIEPTR